METISKKAAKKLRARERHNAMYETSSHKGSTPPPPTQLSEFPDINVQQEAANYYRSYQLRTAPTLVVEAPANKSHIPAPAPIPSRCSTGDETVTATVHWSNPETVTLEQIDENTRRLLREWPKDNGTPFPMEILEVLRNLKLKVLARDAERRHSETVSVGINTTAPNTSVLDQDLIFTSTNNSVYPTTATADLWRKTAKKAAKMAYQHEYYGTVLRTSVLTQSRVQPVTIITPAVSDPNAPIPTPALIPTPTHSPSSDPIATFELDTATPTLIPASATPAPAPNTTTDSSTAATTKTTTVAMAATVESQYITRRASGETKERMEERKSDERQGSGVEITENTRETEMEREINEEEETEFAKEIRTQTGKDDATRCRSTPFDWATDVEESLGPIPVPFVDRAPDAASIIGAAPSASKPRATMSLTKPSANECRKGSNEPPTRLIGPKAAPPTPTKPDCTPPKPTTAPSSSDVAPCAVQTAENETARTVRNEGADDMSKVRTTSRNAGEMCTPSASVKHNTDKSRTPIARTDRVNPTPAVSTQPALATTDNPAPAPAMGANPVTDTLPTASVPTSFVNRAPTEHASYTPITRANRANLSPSPVIHSPQHSNSPSPITPTIPAPIIHGPRDLSGLQSGVRNPWGSINHRRRRFHPPRDHLFSPAERLQPTPDLFFKSRLQRSHSYSHPRTQLDPHSPVQLQPTAHIFQVIQHPHGISPTKPKITKIIPTATTKILQNIHAARCACGNIIPARRPDCWSWRSRDRSFRRSFRSFWDRERGRSHAWGGHL
jgi:hypothetical protein